MNTISDEYFYEQSVKLFDLTYLDKRVKQHAEKMPGARRPHLHGRQSKTKDYRKVRASVWYGDSKWTKNQMNRSRRRFWRDTRLEGKPDNSYERNCNWKNS